MTCCEACGTEQPTARRRPDQVMVTTYNTKNWWHDLPTIFICDPCDLVQEDTILSILQRDERERMLLN